MGGPAYSAGARVLTTSASLGSGGRQGLRELSDGVSWEVRKSSRWRGFGSFPAHTWVMFGVSGLGAAALGALVPVLPQAFCVCSIRSGPGLVKGGAALSRGH